MTDENKSETEVETQDLQEKYDELLEELALKEEELQKVKEDLEKSESETQEYISLSQRLQADFENFKKITDKESLDSKSYGEVKSWFIKTYFPEYVNKKSNEKTQSSANVQ